MTEVDVVVVGAGAAGLACARDLITAGLRVVVVEARDRVGGRVRTLRLPAGDVVELGAQVIHPVAGHDDDLLAAVVRSARVRTTAMARDAALQVVVGGNRLDAAEVARHRPPAPWVVEQQLGTAPVGDGTVFEALAGLPADRRDLAVAWLDQVVGGDSRTLDVRGVLGAREARAPGQERVVADGFDRITDELAVGVEVRLRSPVECVRWSADGVRLDGPDLVAAAAVVTVPPAVIAAGGIRFAPELPGSKADAIGPLASGDALVVVLTTAQAARRSSWVLFADEPGGLWRTTAGSVVVSGHLKGPAAGRGRRTAWTIHRAEAVCAALDPSLGAVTSVEICDWGTDPYARGAYSVPVAGTDEAAVTWARPVDGVLFFAGEASAPAQLRGLFQGAVASGRRAARQVLGRHG